MHTGAGGPVDLEAALANMGAPVKLVFFAHSLGRETCLPARQIVDRLASLSDRISIEEFSLVLDKDQLEAYGIQRALAIAVVGGGDTGLRVYGVPDGHELVSLVESVLLVASGDSGLSDESRVLIPAVAAVEYPDLVRRYVGTGVPNAVVNDRVEILGAVPEASFVSQVLDSIA